MSTKIQRSENHRDICKFENYNRIVSCRRLKVGNTQYEFCAYHRSKNSINKKFPYKTIFDQQKIELKYYDHTNEHILSEYYNYIINLFKNHKFGFPIKITIFTENLLHNIKEIDNDNEIDVTNITNYQNYFDTNSVKVKDIYKVILQFIGYDKKLK